MQIFLTKIFVHKILWTPKFFDPKFFWLKLFWTRIILNLDSLNNIVLAHHFFGHNFFLTQNFLDPALFALKFFGHNNNHKHNFNGFWHNWINLVCSMGTKPNLLNQIYKTKSTKSNLPEQHPCALEVWNAKISFCSIPLIMADTPPPHIHSSKCWIGLACWKKFSNHHNVL